MSAETVMSRSTTLAGRSGLAGRSTAGFLVWVQLEGVEAVKSQTAPSTWYRLVKQLKADGRWPPAPRPSEDLGTLSPVRFSQTLETPKGSSVSICPGDTADPDSNRPRIEGRSGLTPVAVCRGDTSDTRQPTGGGRAAAPLSAPAPTSQPEPQNSQLAGARSGVGAGAGGLSRELAPAPAASPEAIRGARAPTPPGTPPEGAP